MITYGDLDFTQLPVDFAHYTMRRGRAKKQHSPSEMPKYLWKDKPKDEFTYFYITENADMAVAPTKADEVVLPLTANMKFESEDQMKETLEILNKQGIEFPELAMDGVLTLGIDGNVTATISVEEPANVVETTTEIERPFKVKKKKGKTIIPSEAFFEMIDLYVGDRIKVYDSHGYECDQYVLVMSFEAIPKLRNTRTKREIDLIYILDLEYEVMKRGSSFND